MTEVITQETISVHSRLDWTAKQSTDAIKIRQSDPARPLRLTLSHRVEGIMRTPHFSPWCGILFRIHVSLGSVRMTADFLGGKRKTGLWRKYASVIWLSEFWGSYLSWDHPQPLHFVDYITIFLNDWYLTDNVRAYIIFSIQTEPFLYTLVSILM